MMQAGVWLATAQSRTLDVNAVTRHREEALVTSARRLATVGHIERYCAFNLVSTAVVAGLDALPLEATANAGTDQIVCRTLSAVKCAEFIQPGESDPIGAAPILYSVLFKIPAPWHAEFDAWYDTDHMPLILSCKEWAATVRYHVQGSDFTHLALHYIRSATAFDDPALKAARLTPWRNRLLAHRWFTDVEKTIYFRQSGA